MLKIRANVVVAEGGRIVIPVELRRRLGLEVGSEVVLAMEGDHATLTNRKTERKKARQTVRRYVPAGTKLSEELIAERKEAARHE